MAALMTEPVNKVKSMSPLTVDRIVTCWSDLDLRIHGEKRDIKRMLSDEPLIPINLEHALRAPVPFEGTLPKFRENTDLHTESAGECERTGPGRDR
jgi:hypothetical protein